MVTSETKLSIQHLEALIADVRRASEGISAYARTWHTAGEGPRDVSALFNLSDDLDIIAGDLDAWIEEA
jgi:hypothetical protein